jgi:hypothetical protein
MLEKQIASWRRCEHAEQSSAKENRVEDSEEVVHLTRAEQAEWRFRVPLNTAGFYGKSPRAVGPAHLRPRVIVGQRAFKGRLRLTIW